MVDIILDSPDGNAVIIDYADMAPPELNPPRDPAIDDMPIHTHSVTATPTNTPAETYTTIPLPLNNEEYNSGSDVKTDFYSEYFPQLSTIEIIISMVIIGGLWYFSSDLIYYESV